MLALEDVSTEAELSCLLDYGADINERLNDKGEAALHLACAKLAGATFRMLCEFGADVNANACNSITPLMLAARAGHLSSVRTLIVHGAAVNSRTLRGATPLMFAVLGNSNVEVVRELLANGARVKDVHLEGEGSFLLAATSCNPALLKTIITSGVNVNAVAMLGYTCLEMLTKGAASDVNNICLLLAAGASMSFPISDASSHVARR
jgi:ankyrin repeat protein